MPSDALLRELRLFLFRGPSTAEDARVHLGISQPTFSRLVEHAGDQILAIGRRRSARYLATRDVADVGRQVPIYEVEPAGTSRQLGRLHATGTRAFYFEGLVPEAPSGHFEDLPYFLYDLRPAGFLGRLIPRHHPALGLPADIQHWTADQTLGYLTRFGWNLSGNLILGDEAFRLFVENTEAPPDLVPREGRQVRYAALANDIMALGTPGSSAAGEQPKFLVTRASDGVALLVKFSPPIADLGSTRLGDLLIAEHVALEVMRNHGHSAATSELVTAEGRIFLEVERFDRLPGNGRRGLLSLFPLDAELVGGVHDWTVAAEHLAQIDRLGPTPLETLTSIRWRHAFGRLIANTDMHGGNLSFFTQGTQVVGLAPAYDMGPALYAPMLGHVTTPTFAPPTPSAADGPVWASAAAAARVFWTTLATHALVSPPFQTLAARNADIVTQAAAVARRLPRAT